MAETDTYVSKELLVEVRRWGPTWEQMLSALTWLGTTGTYFKLYIDNDEAEQTTINSPLPPVGLPRLIMHTHEFDMHEPRQGHYLVKYAQGDVRVLNPTQFRREIEQRW